MSTNANPIPEGASIVIPRLVCREPAAEIDFIQRTFKAEERVRRPGPDGKLSHALLTIGPAMIMIESEWPTLTNRAPQLDGTSPVVLFVYVQDVDQTVERALAAGAKVLSPAANQFWGDRTAWVMDPSGHVWTIAMRIEDTSEEQRKARLGRVLAATKQGPDAE
jgi:PhnB protein